MVERGGHASVDKGNKPKNGKTKRYGLPCPRIAGYGLVNKGRDVQIISEARQKRSSYNLRGFQPFNATQFEGREEKPSQTSFTETEKSKDGKRKEVTTPEWARERRTGEKVFGLTAGLKGKRVPSNEKRRGQCRLT